MDYEVFLISRMREFWLASDRTRAANKEAVALGNSSHRPGGDRRRPDHDDHLRWAHCVAGVDNIPFGLGLTLAVLADATVIRMVLLPATMALLGRWNWWAPRRARAETDR